MSIYKLLMNDRYGKIHRHIGDEENIIRRATMLFPIASYSPISAVRHARREYVRAIEFLKQSPKWSELYN